MNYIKKLLKLNKWGKWEDLSLGYYDEFYLIQGRRHRNGKIQFRLEKYPRVWAKSHLELSDLKKLI